MDYSFNGKIAEIYGVDEAVFIHNLYWWIAKNQANNRHFYEGRNWTYNSMEAFSKLFPFWTTKQIRRIIKKLSDNGAIHIGRFNASNYDRTQWYSLDETVTCIYIKGNIDLPKWALDICPNGHLTFAQMGTPIPDSKPDINTNINTVSNTPLPPRGGKPKYEQSFLICLELLISSDLSAEEKAKLGEWLQHKRERKDKYTATGFKALLNEYQNNVKQFGQDVVFKAIDQSMAGGYAGIIWDKVQKDGRKQGTYPTTQGNISPELQELEEAIIYGRN